MNAQTRCQSCGMPIEDGSYCQHCTDADGNLQSFDERFERMVQFYLAQKRSDTRAQAERDVLAYMATMPAWRDHPDLHAAQLARQE
ncbi:MAG: hypothetical protein JXO22_00690 [Phycisphaerae bacterium]|nr:hypothetical protein [Phycisphaerae bacterium]